MFCCKINYYIITLLSFLTNASTSTIFLVVYLKEFVIATKWQNNE